MKRYSLLMVLAFLSTFFDIYGHGFGQYTLVETSRQGLWSIAQMYDNQDEQEQYVKSYDFEIKTRVSRQVKEVASGTTNWYLKLGLELDKISCTPTQEFYLPEKSEWVPAYELKAGDLLLSKGNKLVQLKSIDLIKDQLKVYSLEVDQTHNFFVGLDLVLAHNAALPVAASIGFAVAFGEGAATGGLFGGYFGPVSLIGGVAIGGIVGLTVAVVKDKLDRRHYQLDFDPLGSKFDDYLYSRPEEIIIPSDEESDLNKETLGSERHSNRFGHTLKKGYGSPANPSVPRGSSASSPCGPDDDCTYIDAPYHGRDTSGRKSPRPRNGYEALKNSFLADAKSGLRVAIQDGEFVVLRRTSFAPKCEYHGHKSTWQELPQKAKSVLQDHKLVNHNGKIL